MSLRDTSSSPTASRASARFTEPHHAVFRRLNDSIGFDWRLAPYDIAQSRAHASMLARQGIVSSEDRDALHQALEQVERELSDGSFLFAQDDEDIHMAVERRVTEIAGPVGGKLHTGRSRNDQVATDMRLFARRAATEIAEAVDRLCGVLLDRAEEHTATLIPGYTHLQRAQPVRLAHHFLAWFEMLR